MARFDYRLVDVFTPAAMAGDEPWSPCGNPLAVFPDGRGIEPARMQQIAFELNLSETTFVLPSERADCDVRVRIFTPRAEIPMAGHPTVGTAFVLDRGDRIVFEEGVGPVPVERIREDGESRWRMSQPRPRFERCRDEPAAVARALGLDAVDLDASLPLEIVATGPPYLIVPLASLDALARARLRIDRWEALDTARGGVMPYFAVRTAAGRARCRMFAPMHGIAEDPATGSAAGPLGAYWLAHGLARPGADGVARLVVEQGVELGRPSRIEVDMEGEGREVTAVRVAGACRAVGGGWLDV